MWDGRETLKDAGQPTGFALLASDLADQSNAATLTHAQGAASLTDGQRQAIVDFETQLFTAQVEDESRRGPRRGRRHRRAAGVVGPALRLRHERPARRWPLRSSGDDRLRGLEQLAWRRPRLGGQGRGPLRHPGDPHHRVSGLNDDLGVATIQGTCTTCHDTPHAGDHSVPAPLRIGTDDPAPVGGLDASGLPLYTLRNKTTAEMKVTTDPGRALVTAGGRNAVLPSSRWVLSLLAFRILPWQTHEGRPGCDPLVSGSDENLEMSHR